jgi:hypothetical protein
MPDAYVLLQPNCPLRTRSMVVRALELLENGGCDSVVSVSRHHHKIGEIRNELFVPAYAPGTRSQEMPERYFENGLVYVAWSRVVMEGGGIFGARIRPLITDPIYALGDIDTKLDLEVAEFLFAKYRSHFDWAPSPLTVIVFNAPTEQNVPKTSALCHRHACRFRKVEAAHPGGQEFGRLVLFNLRHWHAHAGEVRFDGH